MTDRDLADRIRAILRRHVEARVTGPVMREIFGYPANLDPMWRAFCPGYWERIDGFCASQGFRWGRDEASMHFVFTAR